jgi:glycosyltransferase involved in cell wall biosynthesis
MNALAQRLKRTGRQGRIEPIGTPRGGYRINPVLARRPLVSIVIPTAAKSVMIEGKKRDLIAACVKSIVDKSTYRNIEFIIVDNGDLAPERLSHAKDVPVRCVTYLDRQLNISKKMNMGAACAAGEFLLLLNDDTEIISPDWIERLLFHFEKPHAGLVGGKLLYPDKTIQHAGVVVVHGHPDHVSRGEPRDFDGYFFSGCAVRNYQAVTGAMSLIPASLYRNLGGYEEHMPLTFNDIDLSMKVWDAGYTVIFDPDVELFHFEGKSATNSYNFDDRDSFYGRWGRSPLDRFYNEYYLSIGPAEYRFKENVRFI